MWAPIRLLMCALAVLILTSCATSPPKNTKNVCAIFDEKSGWYRDTRKASERWGVPIPVIMAFMHQESRFKAKAKPPRKKYLGFIPGPRPSNAYGYTQALKGTWKHYKRSSGNYGADRDDFGDAADFIGWYNHQSFRRNKIQKTDIYRQYLAYHEGQGGYSRGSFNRKSWLLNTAKKVQRRAQRYETQLKRCEEDLNRSSFWPFS